ncbi:hypothetical protein OG762_25655 [Streptomyces sp. NBC_01136]|uniref:hypothetical protein n=1 Tax=Streptomyces sp. NBC_01136 TaxID=2903754 RepID=UPI00386B04F8|nr:hypothetical protein OG762_25655 [Streptomyces sp. NBC_01136]
MTWTVTGVSAAEAGIGEANAATAAPAIRGLMTIRFLIGATSLDFGERLGQHDRNGECVIHATESMIKKRKDAIARRPDPLKWPSLRGG